MSLTLSETLEAYPLWSELKEQIKKSPFIGSPNIEITLSYRAGRLQLDSDAFSNVYCDFLSERYLKEVRQSYGRSEGIFSFLRPLTGYKKIKICDTTVGLGKDLFKFVLAGHDVVGFERNPVMYHLVLDGIKRFYASDKLEELQRLFKVDEFKVELKNQDSSAFPAEQFDLVYFDPMFDDVAKKAAPKKGMQALKELSVASEEFDKIKIIEIWKPATRKLVYKCSGLKKDFPFSVSKEIKGKGFSYLILL